MNNLVKCFSTGCLQEFNEPNQYIAHLKTHDLEKPLRLVCTFYQCTQKLSTMYRFCRHLKTHFHIVEDQRMEYEESVNCVEEHCSLDSLQKMDSTAVPLADNANITETQTDNIADSLKSIDRMAINFVLELHKRRNFTRKDVVEVQKAIKAIYSYLEQLIRSYVPSPVVDDPQQQYIFEIMLRKISTLFDFIDTEHKLCKYLDELDLMRKPQVFVILSDRIIEVCDDNVESVERKSHLVLMDIEFQIRKFLETDHVLEEITKNTENLQNQSKICNFINGTTYKAVIEENPSKFIIPLFFYTDEFEINDPLSSHVKKHSICGLYYSFPTLPEHYKSKLCNIFVAGAIKKVDISEHGVDRFLVHVIEKLEELEIRGVSVNIKNQEQTVYIALMLVQGDNLGLHQFLKFSGSFSANYYCRFCRRMRDQLSKDDKEHLEDLRTLKNYETDLLLKPSECGIVANSIFNRLPSFHVVQNLYADCMHDLYSTGVCFYGFLEIINYCIHEKKYCTLAQINNRRKSLNNFRLEQGLSRMPDIDESYMKSKKKKSVSLRMTANEMAVFSNFFTFVFGPFFPPTDPVWAYAIVLIRLLDTINLPAFSIQDLNRLNNLVTEHHNLYTALFDQHLKPKQHFLTHYANIITHSGPLNKISCFRYEARHRDFKQYFDNTSSRKNPCLTMCIKASIFFAYDVINANFLNSETMDKFEEGTWQEKSYFNDLNTTFNINRNEPVQTATSLKYKNINYKIGNFLTVTFESTVEAYQIVEIVKYKSQIYAVVALWTIQHFNEHYQAFEIGCKQNHLSMINIDMFDGPPFALERVENT